MVRHRKREADADTHSQPSEESIAAHDGVVLVVAADDLQPLAIRPSLGEYVRQLWERRFFIVADAKAKALRSTRDYRLWKLWLVLNPLFDVAFYGFLFGFLFKTSRGIDNFVGWLFIGIIFMRMLGGLFTSGSGLLASSRAMIRAFNFPRASIVFSQMLRQMIDNALPAAVAIATAFLLQWGRPPTWTLILVIPIYVLMHLFGAGLMFILARLTAKIPDSKALIPLVTQAWFFLSGVMFSLDRFAEHKTIHTIMTANPAHWFLSAVRETTIYGHAPSVTSWVVMVIWTAVVFLIGFVYFWGAEEDYVRIA